MKRLTMIAAAVAMVLLAVFAQHVAAQQPDTRDRTIMTFSNAVELPGLRLEPGTYVFRIADTPSRNVIQVLSQDEMQMLGQWLFVSAERQEATGDTVVTFREASADTTPAVQFWYYPGEKIGKEFIYPKDQAMRIAQRTGATVLTEEGPVNAGGAQASVAVEKTDSSAPAADSSSAPAADSAQQSAAAEVTSTPAPETQVTERQGVGVVEGSGFPESTQAETRPARPAPAPAQSEVPVGTSGRADQQTSDNVRQESTTAQRELPRTASPLVFSGLLGLLSLAGAFGVRFLRG
jgi:hypothetical protein